MKLNSFLVTSLLVLAFTEAVNASILDKKFVKKEETLGPDYQAGYTLQDNPIECFSTDATFYSGEYKSIFNAPEVHTYDLWGGFGASIKFAADINLPNHAKTPLERLLGQMIPDNQTFQLIVQKSSALLVTRDERDGVTNGGISPNKQEPISLKAQYPYAKYAQQNWHMTTIDGVDNVTEFFIYGNVTVDAALLEDSASLLYPRRSASLSVHNNDIHDWDGSLVKHGTTLSPDILHLYRGDQPLGRLDPLDDTCAFRYSEADYNRLIKGEDKTMALLYKIRYDDWQRRLHSAGGYESTTRLQPELDRWGLILMLSDADYDGFNNVLTKTDSEGNLIGTLREALSQIALVNNPINDVKIIDMLKTDEEVQHEQEEIARREAERQAEIERQRQADIERQEAARREAERQAEIARQEAERQAEIARQEAERQEIARREAERQAEIERQRQEIAARWADIERRKQEAARQAADEDIRHQNEVNRQLTEAKDDADRENARHQEEINRIRNLQDEAKQQAAPEDRKRLLAEAKQQENIEKKRHQEEMKQQRTEAKTQANIEKSKHLDQLQVIKRQQAEIKKQQAEAKKAELARKNAEALEKKKQQLEEKKRIAEAKKAELARKKAEALERKRQQLAEKKELQSKLKELQIRTNSEIKGLQNTAKGRQAEITNQMKLERINMADLKKQLRRATADEKASLTERLNNAKAELARLADQLKEVKRQLSIDIRELRIRAKAKQTNIRNSYNMPR